MEKIKSTKQLLIGTILLIMTAISLVMGSEAIFGPILILDFVFISMWKFKPTEQLSNENAAYRAIISFGLFSALASILLSIFIPIFAVKWNIETHSDNSFLYPIVNDGRENCYIASLLFVFYIVFSLYYRRKK